jgi:hypothetical protein
MTPTRPAPLAKAELPTAQIAKAALRRLAIERLEPTPRTTSARIATKPASRPTRPRRSRR